jgi:hypothetical protein
MVTQEARPTGDMRQSTRTCTRGAIFRWVEVAGERVRRLEILGEKLVERALGLAKIECLGA